MRIVQLSDIHISPTMTELHLEQLIERVNALDADVLLATGDFVIYLVKTITIICIALYKEVRLLSLHA